MNSTLPTTVVVGKNLLDPTVEEVPPEVLKKPVRDKNGVPQAGTETDPLSVSMRGVIETGRSRAAGEKE